MIHTLRVLKENLEPKYPETPVVFQTLLRPFVQTFQRFWYHLPDAADNFADS